MKRNEVYCRRGGHRLAWLETDDEGGLVVVAEGVAPGRERITRGQLRVPAADIEDYAGFTVTVGCACRARWQLDLCDVISGRQPDLHRLTGDDFPGVSFDR